jgi:hypothetical protein
LPFVPSCCFKTSNGILAIGVDHFVGDATHHAHSLSWQRQ